MKNIFRILEVLLVLQALYKCSYSQDDCNPYTKCAIQDPGYKVIDPKSCHNYYYCVEGVNGVVPSDNYYECQSGYYFKESSQNCYSGACTNQCFNLCQTECTLYVYERIADPNDCSVFYTCRPEKLIVKSQCPAQAPYFDGDSCTDTSFSCCDTCTPYCKTAYTEIADPFSCTNYYTCLGIGVPSESNKFSCPASEVFNSALQGCTPDDSNNPCVPLCANSTTETTTQTIY